MDSVKSPPLQSFVPRGRRAGDGGTGVSIPNTKQRADSRGDSHGGSITTAI
jgi:hypothetical protein